MGDIFALQSRPVTPSIHLSEKAEPLLVTLADICRKQIDLD